MRNTYNLLPDWSVDQWFSTAKTISLTDLRGSLRSGDNV